MHLTRARACFALTLGLASAACSDRTAVSADPDGLFAAGAELRAWDVGVVRARGVTPRLDVTEGGLVPGAGRMPTALSLNLFDDARFDARLARVRRTSRGLTWEGTLADGHGEVMLTVVDGVYAGTVRTPDALFQIGHRAGGHYVAQIDDTRWDEHPPLSPPPTTAPSAEANADGNETVVDVMVVYTADARDAAGGLAAVEAVIDLAVAETNQSYAQSGVAMQLQLVHSAEVAYSEAAFDWSETLTRLQAKSDGFMDEVHSLRDAHGADHVVLLVNTVTNYAGIGYQMQALTSPFFADWAFSVVARTYATGAYTFAHELGHNMGANHDVDNSSDGFFPYSHGLQVPEAGFRTVMAYPCSGCVRVNRWSSPLVTYNGAVTGIADQADNARSLDGTRAISAGFREKVVGPPTDVAEMLTPEPGSQLADDAVTFAWEDAGALGYHLDVGNELGDATYHGAAYKGVSATVVDLPRDGTTIFVRLWSESSTAGWVFNDYAYTAADPPPPPIPATIVGPAPGSVLPGRDVTFVWNPSSMATGYWLRVGTAQNPSAYHDLQYDLAVERALVSGLPVDGSDVVVSLGTRNDDGVWLTTYADYEAATQQDGPPLLAPVIGTVLTGIVETFRWQDFGAFQYWIEIKRADGTYVFNGSAGTATQHTVTGLPTDGSSVTVTIYADVPLLGWVSFSATYTAANQL